MRILSVIVLILIMSINIATYFEIKEISMKMDGFQTIEVEDPVLLKLIKGAFKWLV